MRSQDELERESRRACANFVRIDPTEAFERSREGLARRLLVLCGVLAPASQAVMLFGDVRQLEVEAEGSQNLGLIAGRERAHGVANRVDIAGRPCISRMEPDPLLGLE